MNLPPSPPPPSLPSVPTGSFFYNAARAAWLSVVLSLGLNILLVGSQAGAKTKEMALAQGSVGLLMMLIGVAGGIIALCGIPKRGTKGLLWPALTGLLLWSLLIAIALPTFFHARKKALEMRASRAKKIELSPVARMSDAERVQDSELGFVFELPAGYRAIPAESRPKGYRYAFFKPGVGEENSALMVRSLGGTIGPNQHLNPAQLPPGKNITVTTLSWRGLEVDAIRVPEKTVSGDYVTFNVQIPLKKQAIQISFGGPAASESLIKARAGQVLNTLNGEINW